jgi:hypothetical protein
MKDGKKASKDKEEFYKEMKKFIWRKNSKTKDTKLKPFTR